MLITFVLVVHTLLAAALVWVILIQRSEGGALGIGSGPAGMLSARGAANFLTRTTAWLAAAFIGTSILLAVLAGYERKERPIDASLAQPAPTSPIGDAPPVGALPGVPGAPPAAPTPTDDVPVAK